VSQEHLAQYVSDGCLFYKFISTGLREIKLFEDSIATTDHAHLYPNRITNQGQDHHWISIELQDDAVEISAAHVTSGGDPNFKNTPWLLHDCVFGFSTDEGPYTLSLQCLSNSWSCQSRTTGISDPRVAKTHKKRMFTGVSY
jgi:hypothetical protein